MKLVRSNRTEALADALATEVRARPLPPLEKEVVVVQSLGMERWLSLALAERLGVWANPWFPFPRPLIEWVLGRLDLGASEASRAYEPSRLKWTVAQILRDAPPEGLRSYLSTSADEDRALRLATSVATTFDQYVVYRPDMLAEWTGGGGEGWQPRLWREIVATLGPDDLASRILRGIDALRESRASDRVALRRLQLFSLETLPPLFVGFFRELAAVVPTTVYSLEPSEQFLGDVASKAERARADAEPTDGHPFLIDVGRLARDFQQLLLSGDGIEEAEPSLFVDPGRDTLLQSVQSDILEFRAPPRESKQRIDAADCSITIHACPGPMREAQVLHDLVRGALEDDPDLQPEDILVMTPDLETYAPVFRAVFGGGARRRIPFEIHDRKTREDTAFHEEMLTVLEVLDSRFSVLDVVRLMDARSMREDFRFTQDERARLAELLAAAGVRWGIDAVHRADLGFPKEELHTWRAGLDRLFLGFALPPDALDAFAGVLPRGAPSLEDAELVARLARLCDVLFDFHRRTRAPLRLDAWAEELGRMCSELFSEDDGGGEATRRLRDALDSLGAVAREGGYGGAVSLKTFRRELAASLVLGTPPVGFLRRGVTLTQLVPLRSVPFKVVCLLGMSEAAFPRSDDRPSFDHMRTSPRAGDRNRRDDDRHSFLQALLCARQRLILSYSASGSGLRAEANPSPVVWELRETIDAYYTGADGQRLLEPIVHPLHAFDPAYFTESRLPRSFSARFARIATRVCEPPAPDVLRALVAPREEPSSSVSVAELARWLWNPFRAFLEGVLKARFDDSELYEPAGALTDLTPLAQSRAGNEALRAKLRGEALHRFYAASPEFPDGAPGAVARARLAREVEMLFAKAEHVLRGEQPKTEARAAILDGGSIEGRLDGLLAGRRVIARFTKPSRKAELRAWIEHLLLHCTEPERRETILLLRGDKAPKPTVVTLAPVDGAREHLERLLALYHQSRQAPLPLIEKASWVCVDSSAEKRLQNAAKELSDRRRWDHTIDFVFGPDDPFADDGWAREFERVAEEVYGPLLRHRSTS